jgi:hypothetical protein
MTKLLSKIRWSQHHLLPLLATVALALGGCATSEPARFSTGPVKARTFNFVRMDVDKQASYAEKRAEVNAHIQTAITDRLAAKGLTKVETNGDVAVLYLIIISDGASTKTINDYFGYSDAAYALQDKAHQAFVLDKRNPTAFDAGTLVIDIVDMSKGTILWRNFVYRPILRDLPTEQRQARLQEAVNEAFKTLQIAK